MDNLGLNTRSTLLQALEQAGCICSSRTGLFFRERHQWSYASWTEAAAAVQIASYCLNQTENDECKPARDIGGIAI